MDKKRILVIEDNFEVRDNISEILELSGYDVVQAENGKRGIEAAREHHPDLIICDVMMPELDGFGVLKILNKDLSLNHIPLIFLTAKAEKTDFRKGMGLGAEDYITKPFDDTELLEAIEMRLQKSARLKSAINNADNGLKQFFSEVKAHEEFKKLALDKEKRSFTNKDIIYAEGQSPRWLYFVKEGQVRIYQTNDYGKELTIKLINPNEFFGYFALLNDEPYSNTASCTEDTILQLIPKEDFTQLLYNNRDFAAHFIKMIANNAHHTESKLIEMAYSSVRKKVANALLELLNSGEHNDTISASRDDLAALAGTAKETLIRMLSDFKSEGIIAIENKLIRITSREKLENLIG